MTKKSILRNLQNLKNDREREQGGRFQQQHFRKSTMSLTYLKTGRLHNTQLLKNS